MVDGKEVKGTGGNSQFVLKTREEGDTISLQVNRHFVEITVAPVGRTKLSYRCAYYRFRVCLSLTNLYHLELSLHRLYLVH